MPCVRIKEAYHNTKHIIDDIELSCKVEELKEKAAAKTNIPIDQQNFIFAGELLKDEKTLDSYGIKDGFTIYVMIKNPEPEPIELDSDDVPITEVIPVLEAAIKSPSYRNTVEKILTNPDMLEQLTVATPGLSSDHVAMTLLQDPELLEQLVQTANVETVMREHPSLVQAASYIAAAIAKEGGLVAQAELVAANEESIQALRSAAASRGASSSRQPVTSSLLSSALANAGISPGSSTRSEAGPSTSRGASTSAFSPVIPSTSRGTRASSSRPTITRDMVSEAVASVMNISQQSSQLQSQLQQLRDMGITDDALSIQALTATGGNVQAALDLIFEGL
nr:ubiquitin-like protein 7 isoform X2 [Pocillopora verrucosa]